MSLIEIRKISVADLPLLHAISRQTFIETFAEVNTEEDMNQYLSDSFNDERLTSELLNANSEFYFAEIDGQPAGYLKVNFGEAQTDVQDRNTLELERIYVLKDFLGKQVGQILLDKAIQIAKKAKVDYLWLGVWEHNPRAKKFYTKNGFVEFGRHDFWLGSDKQTDLMMRLEIKG
jgi:ribosomal protein S18 acetylase RimI-like enzyme